MVEYNGYLIIGAALRVHRLVRLVALARQCLYGHSGGFYSYQMPRWRYL
jgi:hypothetical protein